MADGRVVVSVDADAKNAQKELDKLSTKIDKMESELRKSTGEQSNIKSQLDAAKESAKETETALQSLREESEKLRGVKAGDTPATTAAYIEALNRQEEVSAKIKEQEALLRQQDKEVQSLDAKYARITDKVNEQTSALDESKRKAGELADQLTNAGGAAERMEAASKKVSDSMNKFGKRLSGLFRRVLFFSLSTRALQSLRSWMGKAIMQNEEARASFAKLKAALLTLAQPILQVVIPVFVALLNILTQVVTAIAKFFGMLSGKSWSAQKAAAKSLNDEQKAISGVGAAADDAKKSLAGFDEVNQLTADKSGGGGGGAASEIAPDFSSLDIADDKLHDILGLVLAIGAGLLAWKIAKMFGLGLAQAAGLALAVAGAVALVYFWLDAWTNGIDLENFLGMFAGLAALAGGLALAFGSTAAGIALIVGGLAMLVVGVKDVIENGLTLENMLTIITGLIAAGLGIGLLTGNWIPLLIAAIASIVLALVYFTGHGEELIGGLRTTIEGFGKFFKGVFAGDMEMASEGIKQVWDGLKQTWNAVVDSIKDAWGAFIDWMKGKNPEIAAMFQTIGDRFSGLFESGKKTLKGVITFISGVFSGDWKKVWSGIQDIFGGIWNSMIATVEGAINFIIAGINLLISALNKIQINVPDWVPGIGGKSVGINIPPVKTVSLPRLATGAVIPPNREFMAVLGDQRSGNNIEAPESLIRQIVREESVGSGRLEALLQTLIEITREGKTLELDGVAFAKVAKRSLNNNARAYGVPITR